MTTTATDALTIGGPLAPDALAGIDAWWRAANYLSVGQIYLLDDPLLESRCGPSTSSLGCSAIGAPRQASTSCTRTRTGSSVSAGSRRCS